MHCRIFVVKVIDVEKVTCMSTKGPDIDTQAFSKYSLSVGVYPFWYHCASTRYDDLHKSPHCNVGIQNIKDLDLIQITVLIVTMEIE